MDFKQPHAMRKRAIVRESSGLFIDVGDTVGESSPHYFVPLLVMDDLNQPATKADLCKLEERMESSFSYLSDYLDKILTLVSNLDRRLTPELSDHEKRIKRLEVHAGLRSK